MSFSEAFSRGYAIGDAAKKRRATTKYFERFKELTQDDEDAEPVTSIGGIDVPESAPDAALPSPDQALGGDAAPAAEAAIPPPDGSPPALETDAALPPVRVKAPEAIPLPQAKEVSESIKPSMTQAHIKELDKLAMEAARASGDIEVYSALQKTTDSFLQGKVLKNLGLAQTASQNGETDEVEKYLTKAYRFVPDGNEIKFHRKGDQLMIKDPWDSKQEIPLDSNMIGNIATMLHDPQKWSEIVRSEGKDRRAAANDERRTKAVEDQVAISRDNLNEEKRSAGVKELMDNRKLSRDEANDKYDNLLKVAQASYYQAGGRAAKSGEDSIKANDARQYGESVSKELDNFLSPTVPIDPNNPMMGSKQGPAPAGFEIFSSPDGGPTELGLRAKEIGGGIGIANPKIGPAAAARAGLEITRALTSDGQLGVSPARNTITVMIGGAPQELQAPPGLIQALVAAKESADKFEASAKSTPSWRLNQ